MILYGASGHAKVIIDILKSQKKEITCIFDDDPLKCNLLGYTVAYPYNPLQMANDELIISIGNNLIRKSKSEVIRHKYGIGIHSSAIVSQFSVINPGTVVMHNAVVQSGSVIGQHAILNTSCSVDHDCIIDNFTHISPGAVLCGNVRIGEGTHVGAGAVIIPNTTVGKWVTIGAGAVIIKDVPDFAVVVGNPGKIIKYNYPDSKL